MRLENLYPIERTELQLVNKSMFEEFDKHQTEMVITKSGRRMYPYIIAKVSNLDPNADYCVFVEMELHTRCRFKYNSSVGWSPAGHEEAQNPRSLYLHPESPSKGSHWMSQDISFVRLKLTNTSSPPPGQIVLNSMHKYQPKILIVKSPHPDGLQWAPLASFVFPETAFVAVTAYQNEKIKALKINYNPFAKGFRESGKSYAKRKQMSIDSPDSPGSCSTETSTTPPPQPEVGDYPRDYPNRGVAVYPHPPSVIPVYYHQPHPYFGYQWWGGFNSFAYQYPWTWAETNPRRLERERGVEKSGETEKEREVDTKMEGETGEECEVEIDVERIAESEQEIERKRETEREQRAESDREVEKPVRITNFSIEAILRSPEVSR